MYLWAVGRKVTAVFSCSTVCSEGKPVVMIQKWQFVLWTGVYPFPITACGHAPVCPALHLFILSSDVPHCRVQLLKRLISHSGNLCSQSPCFQLRPCFVYPVNFYFSCCAGCGMSSIDSGFESLCLSWGTVLWYLQILNAGFSWLSTLVQAFSASSCVTAWEPPLPPWVPEQPPSLLCSTLWKQEENLPPIAVSFRFLWQKTRKVIYLPWSRSFCQYLQYPSPLLAPSLYATTPISTAGPCLQAWLAPHYQTM